MLYTSFEPFSVFFYIVFGFIGLLFFLAPFMELERRINAIRLFRWQQYQRSVLELEKIVKQIKPDWSRVEPEARLDLMSKFLKANGKELVAKQVDRYLENYQRPWWKSWAFLPIALFNLIVLGGALFAASGSGGWVIFWTFVGVGWFLSVVNFASFFSTGCHEIPQWNRLAAQNWIPEINDCSVKVVHPASVASEQKPRLLN